MNFSIFFTVLCFLLADQVFSQGIGDRLDRTALLYVSLPLTIDDAVANGWQNLTGDCDPDIGIAFVDTSDGPSKSHPIMLYFTSGGQIAGVGMAHFGEPAEGLEQYWQSQLGVFYLATVSFRPSQDMCSGNTFPETIGTQLVLDQGTVNLAIPLNESAAKVAQWTKGACIGGMGTHWSYDLASAPNMTWQSSNLLPIVTMYNEEAGGVLSAFFFNTATIQIAEPFSPWEIVTSGLMCLNWCDDSCSWDVSFWNTLHFYVDDHSLNTCDSRC